MQRTASWMLLVVAATILLAGVAVSASPAPEYLGCYADRADILHRALPYLQEIAEDMTVDACLAKCASLGFEFSGLEYKHECYCSSRPPPYERLKDEQCATPCGGGGKASCGGALSLSVYRQADLPRPTFDADRPLLCLVMILKDEAHTVVNTLRTVRDAVDCWVVLDTGSTDGTPDIIRSYFADNPSSRTGLPVPGKMFSEPFIDYGATRNRVLVLGKETYNPIFTLMLSADEQVNNPEDLRVFLTDVRYARGTQHGAYPVVMHTGLKFDSIRLARVDAGWRYKARVHEYLAPATGPYVGLFRPSASLGVGGTTGAAPGAGRDIQVAFNATDGPRRFQSQFFIRKILEEDLARNPNDTRSIYYLARTNSGINNHTQAFYYYNLLATRSRWDEEVYHGMVMAALESKHLPHVHWHERQTMLLDAHAFKPQNMDALHALAQDHFDSGRFHLAYLFALRAVELPLPAGLAAIENVLLRPTKFLYDYEGQRLLGFAARQIEEWAVCVRAFRAVLAVQKDDTIVQDRITLCETEMAKLGTYTQPATHPEPVNAAQASEIEGALGPKRKDADEGADGESEGEGEATKPTRLSIPGTWHPSNSLKRRRGPKPTAAEVDADLEDDLALRHAVVNTRGLKPGNEVEELNNPAMASLIRAANAKRRGTHDHSGGAELTEAGTIRLEVSLTYALLFIILVIGAAAAVVLRKGCIEGGRKLKV